MSIDARLRHLCELYNQTNLQPKADRLTINRGGAVVGIWPDSRRPMITPAYIAVHHGNQTERIVIKEINAANVFPSDDAYADYLEHWLKRRNHDY